MKIRPLFTRYQRYLLAFANTRYGKDYLNVGGHPRGLKVVKVAPDGIHYEKEKGVYRAVLHSRSPYLRKFQMALEGMATVEGAGLNLKRYLRKPEFVVPHFQSLIAPRPWLPLLALGTATINPDAHPESTTVDGYVRKGHSDGTSSWASLRNGSGGDADSADDSTATTQFLYVQADNDGNYWRYLQRSLFFFDTSSISDSATVDDGTFSVYVTAADGGDFGGAVTLVQGANSPDAVSVAFAAADFNTLRDKTTKFCDTNINITSLSTSAYNDFLLNASGEAEIDLTGIARFQLKYESDRANSSPTWSSLAIDSASCNYADAGSNEPKLVVNYTLPAGGAFLHNML